MSDFITLVLRPVPSEKYPVSKIVGTVNIDLPSWIVKYAEFKKLRGANIYYEFKVSRGQLQVLLGSSWCASRRRHGPKIMDLAVLFVRALLKEITSELTDRGNLRHVVTRDLACKLAVGKGAELVRAKWKIRRRVLRKYQKKMRKIYVQGEPALITSTGT